MFHHQTHDYARNLLAESLEGIISQKLIRKKDNSGRVLACEVLIPTNSIRSLIKEGKIAQIYSIMQTARSGMITMNQALIELCSAGTIAYEDALANSSSPEEIMAKLQRPK